MKKWYVWTSCCWQSLTLQFLLLFNQLVPSFKSELMNLTLQAEWMDDKRLLKKSFTDTVFIIHTVKNLIFSFTAQTSRAKLSGNEASVSVSFVSAAEDVVWRCVCSYPGPGCSSHWCGNSASCWSFWSRGVRRPDAAAWSADVPECTLVARWGNTPHGSAETTDRTISDQWFRDESGCLTELEDVFVFFPHFLCLIARVARSNSFRALGKTFAGRAPVNSKFQSVV